MIPKDLIDRIVSIQVIEPCDWNQGIVVGRIGEVYEDGLKLKLVKSIRGDKFRSTNLILKARYRGEDLSTLITKRKLMVGGALIIESTGEENNILLGELAI
jgi:hypothetical protein